MSQASSKFSSRFVSGLALALIGASALSGCSMLQRSESRTFQVESSWVRSTLTKEFLGFRRLHRMSPLILDKMVIQGNAIDGLVAYDRDSGKELWKIPLENGVEGGAAVAGDRLFFGSSNGQFYCVNLADGKTLWTFPVRAETLAGPTIDSGVVYFQSGADVVYALDAETGKQLWLYNRQVTGQLSIRSTTRPVVNGESLLVGFSDGFAVSLKKRDGSLLWERKIGRGNRFRDVDSTPVVDGTNIYVASFDGALVSLKADSGEVNWTVEEGAYVPVTLGQGRFSDRLYYATANGSILVLDKNSGKTLSTLKVANGIATQPTVFKEWLLYGESEGDFIVANAESLEPIGRYTTGQGLVSRPAVSDGNNQTAYIISNTANLYALRFGYRSNADRLPWQPVKKASVAR